MPLFFGPGNNSFARCIKNCNIEKHNDGNVTTETPVYTITCPPYKCPEPINSKVLNSNADVDQTLTQTNRVVNAIRTSPGGTIQFGNSATTGTLNSTQYLGRYEGQPGGIGRLSGKNKF